MMPATNSYECRVAERRGVEFLIRLVLILWIVVTVMTFWAAAWKGRLRSSKASHPDTSTSRPFARLNIRSL